MPRTEIEAKLNGVLQRMVSQCEDPREIEQLKAAQIFHNIKGMPVESVGVSVPIGTNRVHVYRNPEDKNDCGYPGNTHQVWRCSEIAPRDVPV